MQTLVSALDSCLQELPCDEFTHKAGAPEKSACVHFVAASSRCTLKETPPSCYWGRWLLLRVPDADSSKKQHSRDQKHANLMTACALLT